MGKKNIAKPSASKENKGVGLWIPERVISGSDVSVVPAPTTLRGAFVELFRAWGRFWRYLWAKKRPDTRLTIEQREQMNKILTEIFNNSDENPKN